MGLFIRSSPSFDFHYLLYVVVLNTLYLTAKWTPATDYVFRTASKTDFTSEDVEKDQPDLFSPETGIGRLSSAYRLAMSWHRYKSRKQFIMRF